MPLLSPYILYPSGGGGASVVDDFNRANENLEANANWTAMNDHTTGNAAIVSNQLVMSGSSLNKAAVLHGATRTDDQWAGMVYKSDAYSSGFGLGAGPCVRMANNTNGTDGYYAEYRPETSTVVVRRLIDGGTNNRETITSITLTDGDILGLEATGWPTVSLRADVNGTPIGSGSTDATHQSGGAGVYGVFSGTDSITWDDFDSGDV